MMFEIYDLIIEITRRCNMQCPHCLRGDAQNLDISDQILDKFLSKIKYINNLTLSGGEPSIAVEKIKYIISLLKKKKIELGSFFIATNAKKITKNFINCLINLYDLSGEKEMCNVRISNDFWHMPFKKRKEQSLLECLKFTTHLENSYSDPFLLLPEGNALKNFTNNKQYKNKKVFLNKKIELYPITIEDNCIQDGIYLNCKGNIIGSCDLSYENQDRKENIIHNVLSRKSLKKNIEKYNVERTC